MTGTEVAKGLQKIANSRRSSKVEFKEDLETLNMENLSDRKGGNKANKHRTNKNSQDFTSGKTSNIDVLLASEMNEESNADSKLGKAK